MRTASISFAILLATATLLSGAARPALSASVGVGGDYYSGPSGVSVRDALAFGMATIGRTSLTGAASRYSSSLTGPGTGAALAYSFPLSRTTSAQVLGARSIGDQGYRATRFQFGPVFPIGPGRTLGISYTRAYDSAGPSTKGLTVEAVLPVSASVVATTRGALASVDGGGTNLQGSAGALWSPAPRLILLGELALGRDATAFPGGGIAVTGPGSNPSRDYVAGPALLIGMRYVIH